MKEASGKEGVNTLGENEQDEQENCEQGQLNCSKHHKILTVKFVKNAGIDEKRRHHPEKAA